MKSLGTILIIAAVAMIGWSIYCFVHANYEYETQYANNWTLADRASTISQKSEYIDKFVDSLEKSGLQGQHDALMYFTPQNSFDENFKALKSLQSRLHEIKDLDQNSFAYQTAIQQITAQEQGEATDMLSVLRGSWYKVHHYWLWNGWLGFLYGVIVFILGAIGIGMVASDSNSRY